MGPVYSHESLKAKNLLLVEAEKMLHHHWNEDGEGSVARDADGLKELREVSR